MREEWKPPYKFLIIKSNIIPVNESGFSSTCVVDYLAKGEEVIEVFDGFDWVTEEEFNQRFGRLLGDNNESCDCGAEHH